MVGFAEVNMADLCHVCPMFLVSLDCLVVIAPSVFANVYLSLSNQIITLMPQMKTNVCIERNT
jgi:hypothetical protein